MTQIGDNFPGLSARGQRTEALPISWLMQQAVEVPGLISLAAGLVDRETLPREHVQSLVTSMMSDPERGREALQYGTTPGLRRLREALVERYVAGTPYADPDQVVVGAGAQQMIELLGEALFDPGDVVVVEAPTYFVYTGVLKSFGVDVVSVPTDAAGMRADDLATTLDRLDADGRLERLKAIYVVGYCQNPGGWSLTQERREEIVALFSRVPEHCVVIEDAAYYELYFDVAERPPLLATFDPTGQRVVTLLTADKPFAPGLKCGWAILPPALVEPVVNLKGNHDFGSTNLAQHIIADALAGGAFDHQIQTLRERYQAKAQVLASALRKEFTPGGIHWAEPDGGLYLWCQLPGVPTDPDSPMFAAAITHKVLYVPGSYAFVQDGGAHPNDRMRLTFGVCSDDGLREGAQRLASAWGSLQG